MCYISGLREFADESRTGMKQKWEVQDGSNLCGLNNWKLELPFPIRKVNSLRDSDAASCIHYSHLASVEVTGSAGKEAAHPFAVRAPRHGNKGSWQFRHCSSFSRFLWGDSHSFPCIPGGWNMPLVVCLFISWALVTLVMVELLPFVLSTNTTLERIGFL